MCAARSADGNWYRCIIASTADDNNTVQVRYVDYGNCEDIPLSLCRELLPQFGGIAINALALKVYLPISSVEPTADENILHELNTLTKGYLLDAAVLDFYHNNWIVEISSNNRALGDVLQGKRLCRPLPVAEVRKQIDADLAATLATTISQPATADNTVPPASSPEKQPTDNSPATILHQGTEVLLSHPDRPDRFFVQLVSAQDDLTQLQENIQIVAASLPLLTDFSEGTQCIVKYSVDELWYRAVIIDSDSLITSILFIDYGNTDTITDNQFIKVMNEAFAGIPGFAIPCALPVDVRSGGSEWSDEACAVLRNLSDSLRFRYLSQGERCNLIQLWHCDVDVAVELIRLRHAVRVPYIENGQNAYVAHINSLSDFYVQMEQDVGGLEIVSDYLLEKDKFVELREFEVNTICTAKFDEDDGWYRAKILCHNAEDGTTEVNFIDYGNSTLVTELRALPREISELPHLSKCCSLRKPKGVQYWSDEAEKRFQDVADMGATVFAVKLVMPGSKTSIVDLVYEDGRNLSDELRELCEEFSASAIEAALQQHDSVATTVVLAETTLPPVAVSGVVTWSNSAIDFYVQPLARKADSDGIVEALAAGAEEYPPLETCAVGTLCVARFAEDKLFYRAQVLATDHDGKLEMFFLLFLN